MSNKFSGPIKAMATMSWPVFLLFGCGGSGSGGIAPEPEAFEASFDFQTGDHGWAAGFADYPAGEEDFYELNSEWGPVGPPLEDLRGILVSGNNHSDDLFMFLKRRIDNLAPNTRYELKFEVEFATNGGLDCFGVGGSPGDSVTIKAGATSFEPVPLVEQQGNRSFYIMNVDKGNQSVGGSDAIVIGDFASSDPSCSGQTYELKTLDNAAEQFTAFTNASGALWLLVGTDSGFESTTTIYYTFYRVTGTPL